MSKCQECWGFCCKLVHGLLFSRVFHKEVIGIKQFLCHCIGCLWAPTVMGLWEGVFKKGQNASWQWRMRQKVWETALQALEVEVRGGGGGASDARKDSSVTHGEEHCGVDIHSAAHGGPANRAGLSWRTSAHWKTHSGIEKKCEEEGAAERGSVMDWHRAPMPPSTLYCLGWGRSGK